MRRTGESALELPVHQMSQFVGAASFRTSVPKSWTFIHSPLFEIVLLGSKSILPVSSVPLEDDRVLIDGRIQVAQPIHTLFASPCHVVGVQVQIEHPISLEIWHSLYLSLKPVSSHTSGQPQHRP